MSSQAPKSIPYAQPFWDEAEERELLAALRSGWWTNGPTVQRFESALRELIGAPEVVCVSSGTAALHAILHLLRERAGRSLMITSSLNFAAAAATASLEGYDVALTDVEHGTLNMDPVSLATTLERCGKRYTQIVIIPVHYAGLPVNMEALQEVARPFGAVFLEDACHALPARYSGSERVVGNHPDSLGAVFSFHPNKSVAAAEGGAIALRDPVLARRLRLFRTHNMAREGFVNLEEALDAGGKPNPWYYEIGTPALNLRLSDLHAAVGLAQLARLPQSLERRRVLAERYRAAFRDNPLLRCIPTEDSPRSGLHLFPVEFELSRLGLSKRALFEHFASRGITLQVHYVPLHRQPAFRHLPEVQAGSFPVLDSVSRGLVSLPLYYGLSDAKQERVIATVRELAHPEGR